MTRDEVIREFHRLCAIVNEAEMEREHTVFAEDDLAQMVPIKVKFALLGTEEAQAMRDRYRERADAVIDALRKTEKVRS
jgi:hypothetical protein